MRNIKLAYVLSFLFNSWFWLGVWVLYYLRYTSYAGIGILESIMIVTSISTEIPTGAIADIIGKKKTLALAFLISGIGNVIMGFAPSLLVLGISIVTITTGSSLYSGTFEALVYDTLKDKRKENIYQKIIANINSIKLLACAGASVVGGFFYTLSPSLPFIGVGFTMLAGFFICLFLEEPRIDAATFSFDSYLNQTKQGFYQLAKNYVVKQRTILLLSIGIFIMVIYNVLNDVLAVEFGFSASQLGIFIAIAYLISAAASQMTPKIVNIFGHTKGLVLIGSCIGASLLVSPIAGMTLGGLTIIFRAAMHSNYDNIASVMINNNTESMYRATTISTFNMLSKIPYALLAYPIGTAMDIYSPANFAFGLGTVLLISVVFIMLRFRKSGLL